MIEDRGIDGKKLIVELVSVGKQSVMEMTVGSATVVKKNADGENDGKGE